MRLWEIEAALQHVPDFEQPRPELEQYITPPHLAAHLTQALQHDETNADADFELGTSSVIDLGCGTGMLSQVAHLAGAAHVVGVDIDENALEKARATVPEADLVRADVLQLNKCAFKCADVALTNPPFGTKRRGVDVAFLLASINAARCVAYSMHKKSTREYLRKRLGSWGVEAKVVATMQYELPKTYKFHSKQSLDIEVDLWRMDCNGVDVILDTPNVERPIEQIGGYRVKDRKMDRNRRRKGKR